MFKILYSYKPATLLTLLCTVSVSPVSLTATAADLADYDYKKAVNGKLLIYKYSGVNAADRVRVGRYIRQAQKFLSARPPTATHIHMFHTYMIYSYERNLQLFFAGRYIRAGYIIRSLIYLTQLGSVMP